MLIWYSPIALTIVCFNSLAISTLIEQSFDVYSFNAAPSFSSSEESIALTAVEYTGSGNLISLSLSPRFLVEVRVSFVETLFNLIVETISPADAFSIFVLVLPEFTNIWAIRSFASFVEFTMSIPSVSSPLMTFM